MGGGMTTINFADPVHSVSHCQACPYRAYGPAIGPRGDPASRIVIVGEAPGAQEIEQGRPFVGPAGGILKGALNEARLDERDLFITNAVACKPYPTPRPHVTAIEACEGLLVADLSAHPRVVVVTLGATAFRATMRRRGFRMKDVGGTAVDSPWGPLIPSLHPARIRRVPFERHLLVTDLARARELARR